MANLIDDLSDEGTSPCWRNSRSSPCCTSSVELSGLSLAECNAYCREFAMQILDELGPYLSDRQIRFCLAIAAWNDRRRLGAKRIETLHHVVSIALRAHRSP